jgi:ribosome-binding protein aMBF1 (putative translation factor)
VTYALVYGYCDLTIGIQGSRHNTFFQASKVLVRAWQEEDTVWPSSRSSRPTARDRETERNSLVAVSEFQRQLMNNLNRQGMSVTNLAQRTGYSESLLENLLAGRTRQIPVDFFVRVADLLDLTMEERDALVRSWAFGIEKRSWRLTSV